MASITFLVAVYLLTVSQSVANANATPIRLTTRNFEHDTQAATGQTTGAWLIRFCEAGVPKCQETVPAWENLANDLRENAHILCADVDVVESDKVARRFGVDNAKLPFYILLRNQKMYEAPSAVTAIYALMYDWAVDGWKDGQGVAVPPEMSGDTFLWLTDGVQHVRSWFIAQLSKAQSRSVWDQLTARAQLLSVVLFLATPIIFFVLLAKSSKKERKGEEKRTTKHKSN